MKTELESSSAPAQSLNEVNLSRRTLLQWALVAPAALAVSRVAAGTPATFAAPKGPFTLPPLR